MHGSQTASAVNLFGKKLITPLSGLLEWNINQNDGVRSCIDYRDKPQYGYICAIS
jgi:hypothetical protein